MKLNPRGARVSWAVYDLANTIFSTNIISLYFVLWLTVDRGAAEAYYGFALGGSIFLAAVLMPIVGAISDTLKRKVPFLIGFTLGCAIFTVLLGLVQGVTCALIFFALANFFYRLAAVPYNSLLTQVSTPQTMGRTSGLGVSLGYIGTILGIHLVRPFLESAGKQATFIPTAALFLFFSLPAFIFVKDASRPYIPRSELKIKSVFSRLIKTFSQIRRDKSLFKFLISAFLCLNAVNTILVYMSIYAKKAMNFNDTEIIYFVSVSTVFAIVGSYLFGRLTDRWGSRYALNLVFKLWCLDIFLAGIATSVWMFWIAGPLAGVCLGATWVAARTMLIELAAKEKIGQMFGLFGLADIFSSVPGPIIWGIITTWPPERLAGIKYRLAVGSVLLFMLAGYLVFQGVRDPRNKS